MSVEGDCVDELRSLLDDNIGQLSAIERQVIRARFALDEPQHDGNGKGKTLEQVGALIGVTKERVRQIQNKALEKLRTLLDHAVLA
jgi:RNA polymerase primary sigma factor